LARIQQGNESNLSRGTARRSIRDRYIDKRNIPSIANDGSDSDWLAKRCGAPWRNRAGIYALLGDRKTRENDGDWEDSGTARLPQSVNDFGCKAHRREVNLFQLSRRGNACPKSPRHKPSPACSRQRLINIACVNYVTSSNRQTTCASRIHGRNAPNGIRANAPIAKHIEIGLVPLNSVDPIPGGWTRNDVGKSIGIHDERLSIREYTVNSGKTLTDLNDLERIPNVSDLRDDIKGSGQPATVTIARLRQRKLCRI